MSSPAEPMVLHDPVLASLASQIAATSERLREMASASTRAADTTASQRRAALDADASALLAEAQSRAEIAHRSAVDALTELSLERPFAVADFDSRHWSTLAPGVGVHALATLGFQRLAWSSEPVPYVVDLAAGNHAWDLRRAGAEPVAAAGGAVSGAALRVVAQSAPTEAHLWLVDMASFGAAAGQLLRFTSTQAASLVSDTAAFDAMVSFLEAKVSRVNQLVTDPDDSLRALLARTPTVSERLDVVVLYASSPLSAVQLESLAVLAEHGPRCAVTMLSVFDGVGVDASGASEARRVASLDRLASSHRCVEPSTVSFAAAPEGAAVAAALSMVSDAISSARSKEHPLLELLGASPAQHSSVETVSAPVGFDDSGSPYRLSVGDLDGVPIGGLILAKSGFGKSTLLHSFINSASWEYGPDELEFHLVDLKGGVEFNEYTPSPSRPPLPTVRVVGRGADALFALAVLENLTEVIASRGAMFIDAADAFNAEVVKVPQYRDVTGETMSRIVVVIDEAHVLLSGPTAERAWRALTVIAQQGRAHGVHAVLSTQSMDALSSEGTTSSNRNAIFSQMGLRVALGLTASEVAAAFGHPDTSGVDLTERKGRALMNPRWGHPSATTPVQVSVADSECRASVASGLSDRFGPRPAPRTFQSRRSAPLSELLAYAPGSSAVVGDPVRVDSVVAVADVGPQPARSMVVASQVLDRCESLVAAAVASAARSAPGGFFVASSEALERFAVGLDRFGVRSVTPAVFAELWRAGEVPQGSVVGVCSAHSLDVPVQVTPEVFSSPAHTLICSVAEPVLSGPLRALADAQLRVAGGEAKALDIEQFCGAPIVRGAGLDRVWFSDRGSRGQSVVAAVPVAFDLGGVS